MYNIEKNKKIKQSSLILENKYNHFNEFIDLTISILYGFGLKYEIRVLHRTVVYAFENFQIKKELQQNKINFS